MIAHFIRTFLSFYLVSSMAFSTYVYAQGGGVFGAYGGGQDFSGLFHDDKRFRTQMITLLRNNINMSDDEVFIKESIGKFLENYSLNDANSYDQREEVLQELAYSLAQRRLEYDYGENYNYPERPEAQSKRPRGLSVLEEFLNEQSIPRPNNFHKAKRLEQIAIDSGEDINAFIEALNKDFNAEEISQIALQMQQSYPHSNENLLKILDLVDPKDLDAGFFKITLGSQLYEINTNGLDPTNEAIIEKILEHYDLNGDPEQPFESSLHCDTAFILYNMTDDFKGTFQNAYTGSGHQYVKKVSEEQAKKWQEDMKKQNLASLEILHSLGADLERDCPYGRSPMDILHIMHREGLIDMSNLAFMPEDDPSLTSNPCFEMRGASALPGICLSYAVINRLERELKNSQSRQARNQASSYHQTNVYGDSQENCNFMLLEKRMRAQGEAPRSQLELKISARGDLKQEFFINSNDQETFFKELRELLKR